MHGWLLIATTVAAGVGVGTFTGLLGVGGGFVIVPYLVLVAGVSQHAAQGTSLLVIVPIALVAASALLYDRTLEPRAALPVAAAGVTASVLGAAVALALPAATLRLVFAVVIGGLGVRMLLSAVRRR